MNVYKNDSTPPNNKPTPGRLYRRTGDNCKDQVHICVQGNTLHYLKDGDHWSKEREFGTPGPTGWEDVTENYCLKKIK